MHVAVIGIGTMGAAIAGRLLDTGARVTVFNRTRAKCAPLAALGARVATSTADAVRDADFVGLSLNSADIVEGVVFGHAATAAASADADAGTRLAAVLRPAQLIVDFSSIDPARTRDFAARLRSACGSGWIDAPLSGGAPAAQRGELVLMVGGEPDDVARAAPLFDRLAQRATHLGGSGAGQSVKLVNQVLCASAFLAVAEAVAFAEALGVDAARIPAALEGGRADSRILQEYMAKMARRDETPTGRIDNLLKDLEAVERAAGATRRTLPVTELITALHRRYVEAGFGAADSAAYRRLLDLPDDAA
jgi:2-hydroxy-3-oxopropionate reductase